MFDAISWITVLHQLKIFGIVLGGEALLFALLWWYSTYTYDKAFGTKDERTGKVKTTIQLYMEEEERKEKRKYR